MIDALEHAWGGASTGIVLPLADSSSSSLIRLCVFIAIFVGPAILKAIKESQRKRTEAASRASGQSVPTEERAEREPATPEFERPQEDVPSGREQWERLMRGESASRPANVRPPLPPPIAVAPARRVLTESRALTEEQALTESQALTDERPVIVATPGTPIGDPTGYDGINIPKSRLGREFADFAPQEGMASDKDGGPAKRIGDKPTFAGVKAFENISVRGAPSEVGKREIGGQGFDVSEGQPQSAARKRMTRAQLRRSMQLAEILGPPVGLRPFNSGPTRPLGWS